MPARRRLRLPGLRGSMACSGRRSRRASGSGSHGSSGPSRPPPRAPNRCAGTYSDRRSCRNSTSCWPSGGILNALARFDPLPSVPGPEANVAGPSPRDPRRAGVIGARGSVVRIIGTACGLGIEGSGWVAARARRDQCARRRRGERHRRPARRHPPGLAAQALAFDPHDDIAVLRVAGLNLPPLARCSRRKSGTAAAISATRLTGRSMPSPAARADPAVNTDDAYGDGPVVQLDHVAPGARSPGQLGWPDGRRLRASRREVFAAITGPPATPAGSRSRSGSSSSRSRWSRTGADRTAPAPNTRPCRL